jgi:glycosyltransferase involved in cell wall biosynthesis
LFAGNFIHPPNLDAALRLARRIFPPVKASHPGARLKIVGDGPPRALRAMESPAIAVTGRVPDMTPLLEEAAVVVVPLRCGGGIRMKMIEALRAGKAVVATALAAEGLEIRPGSEFMLAETDGEFSDAISSLLNQPELRQMLGCRARQWSDSFCRQGRVAAAFESLYTSLRPDRC